MEANLLPCEEDSMTAILPLVTRHNKLGVPFVQELQLDANVFLAFYDYAKDRLFIEALHFFLLVRDPFDTAPRFKHRRPSRRFLALLPNSSPLLGILSLVLSHRLIIPIYFLFEW